MTGFDRIFHLKLSIPIFHRNGSTSSFASPISDLARHKEQRWGLHPPAPAVTGASCVLPWLPYKQQQGSSPNVSLPQLQLLQKDGGLSCHRDLCHYLQVLGDVLLSLVLSVSHITRASRAVGWGTKHQMILFFSLHLPLLCWKWCTVAFFTGI